MNVSPLETNEWCDHMSHKVQKNGRKTLADVHDLTCLPMCWKCWNRTQNHSPKKWDPNLYFRTPVMNSWYIFEQEQNLGFENTDPKTKEYKNKLKKKQINPKKGDNKKKNPKIRTHLASHRHRIRHQNVFYALEIAQDSDNFAKRNGGHDRKMTQ